MKKKIILTMIIIIMVITAVCLFLFMPRKYYIPNYVLEACDNTAEQAVEYYTEFKMYFDYKKIYANKNGDLVFVLTKEQREKFMEYVEGGMQFYECVFAESDLYLEYNDSYTEIIVKCNKEDFNIEKMEDGLIGVMVSAAYCQGALGVKLEDNKVTLKVIDTDTNEVIYEKTLEAP